MLDFFQKNGRLALSFIQKNGTACIYAALVVGAGVYFWPIRQKAATYNACISDFMYAYKLYDRYQWKDKSIGEPEPWRKAFYGNGLRSDAIDYCNGTPSDWN